MEAEGLQAVLIDLRQSMRGPGSAGGHPAVLLADELLDSGTIGRRVRLASREVTYRAEPGSLFPGWPIAVLVDRGTSDHAEWVAAARKENRRATIVARGPLRRPSSAGSVSSPRPACRTTAG